MLKNPPKPKPNIRSIPDKCLYSSLLITLITGSSYRGTSPIIYTFNYKPSQEKLSVIKMKKKFKAKLKKVNESICSSCNICDKCVSAHLSWIPGEGLIDSKNVNNCW